MSARQVMHHESEYSGDELEVIEADAHGGLPAHRQLIIRRKVDGVEDVRVTVLSESDATVVCGALLPAHWWEALLREAYRAGWAGGAEESGGVDRHHRENVHPGEDGLVARLLAQPVVPVR